MSTYKDNKKLKKNLLIVGIILVIGVCFGVGMYFLLDAKEPVKLTSKGTESSEIVKIGNVKCTPKKDIKTYLFMGVDQRGELTKIKKYNGVFESPRAVKTAVLILYINRNAIPAA